MFIGTVEAAKWNPIVPDIRDAGVIVLKVKVTDLLLGDSRAIPTRITYVAGTASMSEAQAKARYEGSSFVFAGDINPLPGGETEIALRPSGKPPFELSRVPEFMREIARLKGIGEGIRQRVSPSTPAGVRAASRLQVGQSAARMRISGYSRPGAAERD